MNVAELEKLKSKRSTNQHLAAEAELAQTDKYFQASFSEKSPLKNIIHIIELSSLNSNILTWTLKKNHT